MITGGALPAVTPLDFQALFLGSAAWVGGSSSILSVLQTLFVKLIVVSDEENALDVGSQHGAGKSEPEQGMRILADLEHSPKPPKILRCLFLSLL